MSWFLAFAGFAALIILHEFGHFVAAKAVGMRVERFALFFPPLLFKVRRGETEYGIGAIPLGGYVRITGMNPHEEIPPEVEHRAYYRQPVWKRIVVIAAGPADERADRVRDPVGAVPRQRASPVGTNRVERSKGSSRRPACCNGRPGIVSVDGVAATPRSLRDRSRATAAPVRPSRAAGRPRRCASSSAATGGC